jgi:uncharacterized protein (DUF433 family)
MTHGTEIEAAELLWREYEYRHAHFWKSLHLWGATVLAVTLLPYVRREVENLGDAVFVFPMLALGLTLLGGWHLAAEVERSKAVRSRYDAVSGGYISKVFDPKERRTPWRQALSEPIGSVLAFSFLAGFITLTLINTLFLYLIAHPAVSRTYFQAGFLLFGVLLVVLLGTPFVRALRHNRRLTTDSIHALDRITVNPRHSAGRPCIRGTCIRVTEVLDLLATGMSREGVLAELPDLQSEDVDACLRFASTRVGE